MTRASGANGPDQFEPTCARCGVGLVSGRSTFYYVEIRAVADPSGPVFSAEDLSESTEAAIGRLLERLRTMSEHELMTQVYERKLACLCGPCYEVWSDDPFGASVARPGS